MKFISLKEFRDLGYLQELNRLFLHPLGMAMAVNVDKHDPDGEVKFAGIIDNRETVGGMVYGKEMIASKIETFVEREGFVSMEMGVGRDLRVEEHGWMFEPITEEENSLCVEYPPND